MLEIIVLMYNLVLYSKECIVPKKTAAGPVAGNVAALERHGRRGQSQLPGRRVQPWHYCAAFGQEQRWCHSAPSAPAHGAVPAKSNGHSKDVASAS